MLDFAEPKPFEEVGPHIEVPVGEDQVRGWGGAVLSVIDHIKITTQEELLERVKLVEEVELCELGRVVLARCKVNIGQ